MQVHLLPLPKHLLTTCTSGTCGMIVFFSSLQINTKQGIYQSLTFTAELPQWTHFIYSYLGIIETACVLILDNVINWFIPQIIHFICSSNANLIGRQGDIICSNCVWTVEGPQMQSCHTSPLIATFHFKTFTKKIFVKFRIFFFPLLTLGWNFTQTIHCEIYSS